MAQLMPLPLTVSCFSKIRIGFTFLVPAHPIWYDTRRYFDVRSRAEISQLNLPHGIKNEKVEKKLKSKKRIYTEASVNSPGICGVSPKEKRKATIGRI